MKILADREALHEAVQIVSGIIPTRSTKPILHNLLLVAGTNGTELLATDLELGIRLQVSGVEVLKAGKVLLPCRELLEILRETSEDRIQVENKDNKIFLRTERSEFNILFEDPEEYPVIPEFGKNDKFTLPAETFLGLANRVTFAVATEASRYAINGVLMNIEGKVIKMVGTDGKRMAYAKGKLDSGDQKLNLILSTKGLNYLPRILGADDKEIEAATHNNQIMFRSSRATLVSLLVEGQFPNYEDVIPRNLNAKVDLNKRALESSLRKARLMTTDDSRAVRMQFDEGVVTLSSRAPEKGESKIQMDVTYKGDALEAGFDPRYMLDGLKVINAETVRLELRDARSPGVLVDGKDFLYVIMPISLT